MAKLKAKKGQGLPLNTIILALIVIVVLVMIIVWFTTQFSQSTQSMGNTSDSISKCRDSNPALKGKYSEVTHCTSSSNSDGCNVKDDGETINCADGWTEIFGITVNEGICCGKAN